ncbi:RNA polymerase sigma factor [Gynurincola endophyticus]|uniref:RNA polymerase sigma factor n=1 Tax=Gynurincola endophyticus TaxID=2479004 RepID=UPI000F8DF375|nr:sigma-70 family RNA polymerase sigma factor [Gynurincola endophyticus]
MSSTGSNTNSEKEAFFQQLFKTYWKKVYNLCYLYTSDVGISKDLTQNIFLSLWERNFLLEDQDAIEKYLSRAAKYQVLNHFRKFKKVELTAVFTDNNLPSGHHPEDNIHYKEILTNIQQEIEALHEPARTIFKLSREKEMSYKEIALHLGLSIKTVEFHISKVLKRLRKHLNVIEK